MNFIQNGTIQLNLNRLLFNYLKCTLFFLNSLVSTKEFEPLLFNGIHRVPYKKGEDHLIKEWCRGYFYASQLDELWVENDKAMNQLVPFIILGKTAHFTTHWNPKRNFLKFKKRNKLIYQENLSSYVKTLYNFWAESRSQRAFFYDQNV